MSIFQLKKSATLKFVSVFAGGAMALSLVFGGAVAPAQAQTVEELTALINGLLAQIATLQTQLTGIGGETTGTVSYSFTKNLSQGDSGADVLNLQKVLNMSADTQVAATGVGSAGNETEYFGSLTKTAVIKFQNKYVSEILTPVGLTAGTGYVGASTRAKLNTMTAVVTPTTPTTPGTTLPDGCTATTGFSPTTGEACSGTGTPVVVTPTGTGLTVTPGVQPTANLAVAGAARVPFTTVVLTASADGDVVVNSLLIERDALSQDAAFAGIVLLDENGQQLGIAKTLNSLHQATIGEAFTVKAGTSKTVTVAGNMLAGSGSDGAMSSYTGQIASLDVIGVNSSATINGTFPLSGARHTINSSLTIGSVTVAKGIDDPNTYATKEVGVSDYTFAAVKVTAGSSEDVRIHSLRWNQSGSASAADFDNLKTYVDGEAYDLTVSVDGKYFTANFGEGLVIAKGISKDISVKGDIVSGSGRTIIFDIYKATDLYITGETYGYGITPPVGTTVTPLTTSSTFMTTTPWFDNCTVLVSDGSISVSKATSVVAQNIAEVVSNQVLGGFDVEVKGEAISVASLIFDVALSGATIATDVSTNGQLSDIDNVSLVDENGSVVAGPVDAVYESSILRSTGTITFTDTVTFPIGTGTYTLKGQLGSNFINDQTVTISSEPGVDWTTVTGQVTGNSITVLPATGTVTANIMTMKAGSAVINTSAEPMTQNVVSGAQDFLFGNFQFDATASGEDIRFTSLAIDLIYGGTSSYLTGCQVYDGDTALNTGSNTKDVSSSHTSGDPMTFTLDSGGFTVAKGTVKTVALKCDISSSAGTSDSYKWYMEDAQEGTGLNSGTTITIAAANVTGSGQLMSVAAEGTLLVVKDNSSPSYAMAAAGSADVVLGKLKLSATNEDITLTKLALELTNASSTNTDFVGQKVTIWDGTTEVGYASFGSDNYATSTLSGTVTIPKDGDKTLTIKGDLSKIKTTYEIGTQGALLKVNYDGTDSTGTQGVGVQSGQTIDQGSALDTEVAGVRVFRAYPVFTKLDLPSNTLTTASETSLYRFSVTAVDSDGYSDGIGIHRFVLSVATSSGDATSGTTTLSDVKVYAYSDAAFSDTVDTDAAGGEYTNGQVVDTVSDPNGSSVSGASSPADNNLDLSEPLRIPAGQTYYFDVRGTGTITTGSGTTANNWVKTYVQGDSAYPSLYTLMGSTTPVDAGTDNDFIWSPFASSTIGVNAIDWTNGYKVEGLPSNGMSSETISQ